MTYILIVMCLVWGAEAGSGAFPKYWRTVHQRCDSNLVTSPAHIVTLARRQKQQSSQIVAKKVQIESMTLSLLSQHSSGGARMQISTRGQEGDCPLQPQLDPFLAVGAALQLCSNHHVTQLPPHPRWGWGVFGPGGSREVAAPRQTLSRELCPPTPLASG